VILTFSENEFTESCRLCGDSINGGKFLDIEVTHSEFNFTTGQNDEINKIDEGPICPACADQWHSLSKKMGRDADAGEFLIYVMSQVKKKTLFGKRILERETLPVRLFEGIHGSLYMDFVQALLEGIGSYVKVECPNCGSDCNTFTLTPKTKITDLSIRIPHQLYYAFGVMKYSATVSQLLKMTESDILKVRGVGHVSLRNIKDDLAKFDLHLGMTDEEIEQIPHSVHSRHDLRS